MGCILRRSVLPFAGELCLTFGIDLVLCAFRTGTCTLLEVHVPTKQAGTGARLVPSPDLNHDEATLTSDDADLVEIQTLTGRRATEPRRGSVLRKPCIWRSHKSIR